MLRGRDVEARELDVFFDKDACRWRPVVSDLLGLLTEDLREVAALLRDHDALGPQEVADTLHVSVNAAQMRLRRLLTQGAAVQPARGKYALALEYGGEGMPQAGEVCADGAAPTGLPEQYICSNTT